MKSSRLRFILTSLIALAFLTLFYQNCSPVYMSGEETPVIKKSMENGGPYGGMFKIYRYYSSVQPCSSQDLKGRALPNTEILFKPNTQGEVAPHLAREACSDLPTPALISASDLQITDSSFQTLTYKNFVMTSQNAPGEFDVVTAQCPVGQTPLVGAVRTNLFVNSLEWALLQDTPNTNAPGWFSYPGIGVGLYSTIQSLPAFLIERNQSSSLDFFNRHSQHVQLVPNTDYAFSFVAQTGSISAADVHIFRGIANTPSEETAAMTCNFQSQTTQTQYQKNITITSSNVTPFGSAFLCTVYFRTSASASPTLMNIGVTPSAYGQPTGRLGDSIVATAAQLVEVRNFCQ